MTPSLLTVVKTVTATFYKHCCDNTNGWMFEKVTPRAAMCKSYNLSPSLFAAKLRRCIELSQVARVRSSDGQLVSWSQFKTGRSPSSLHSQHCTRVAGVMPGALTDTGAVLPRAHWTPRRPINHNFDGT